jgi:hypothetical protein
MKLKIFFITLIMLVVIASCDLPMSAGPQPSQLINTNYAPGLNVLGVIRNDRELLSTSFVYVEQSFREEDNDDDFDEVIYDANVIIQCQSDSQNYTFTNEITDDFSSEIYRSDSLFALAGEEYLITVSAPNLPTLTATTTVPQLPRIDSSSVYISSGSTTFNLIASNDSWMYDIYLIFSDGSVISKRYFNSQHEEMSVSIDYENRSDEPIYMEVFGYDKNLSDYLSVNIVLKPQSYQKPFSTVSSGYGSFGSISKSSFILTDN